MKTKMYEYFINYCFSKGNGIMRLDRNKPIKSMEDIKNAQDYIKSLDYIPDDAIITDFKLLRTYKTTLTQ